MSTAPFAQSHAIEKERDCLNGNAQSNEEDDGESEASTEEHQLSLVE